MMVEIDPVTQVEIIKHRPTLFGYMMCISMYSGMIGMPKVQRHSNKQPWYEIALSKSERKTLTYEESQELKRYKWTLKKIRDRDIWPGMIL